MALLHYGALSSTGPTIGTAGLYSSGVVYWVDSAAGSDANLGLSEDTAFATLAAAISAATASNGDLIVLKAGHTQTLAATQTISKAGLTIVGLGIGSQKASFTNGVAGHLMTISGPGVELRNITFPVATNAAATTKLNVAGAGFRMFDCDFYGGANDGTSSNYLVKITGLYSYINGCTFTSSARGAQGALTYGSGGDYGAFEDCSFDGGSVGWVANAAIVVNTASVGNYRFGPRVTLDNASPLISSATAEKGIVYDLSLGSGCIIGGV